MAPGPVSPLDSFDRHSAIQLLIDPASGSIADANEAAARFYGWPRDQLRQMRLQDLDALPPEEIQRQIDDAHARQAASFEFRHRRADGSLRDVAVFSGPASSPQGRPLLHFIIHDITDHRQRDARLRQALRMEAIGRLVEGVAHDFKNMLQIILGSVELAQMKLDPDSPALPELDEIQEAARRSTEMARHLLAFARKRTFEPQTLPLNETVEGLLKILRRLIGENIELSWRPGPDAGSVHIDPSQIDQLLATLCVHARDSIADTGQIVIETGRASFAPPHPLLPPGSPGGPFARLSIRHDGRAPDPPAPAEDNGLGLASVRDIAARNGGFVEIDPRPDPGPAIHVHLPASPDDPPVKPPPPPPAGGGETILLVEDEESVLRQTERTLVHLGYRVLSASAPDEALRLARLHPGDIHLLLADIVMPHMDGRDLARAIHDLRPRTAALFISAYPAHVLARPHGLDAGLHFLAKPFSVDALLAKIRLALSPPSP